ncbi:MAG: hypothetical protein IIB00_09540 [candidate division Zixibacteria bacterium]|nr:hypothetical protein [candidate division Zixibacteria bacterium]
MKNSFFKKSLLNKSFLKSSLSVTALIILLSAKPSFPQDVTSGTSADDSKPGIALYVINELLMNYLTLASEGNLVSARELWSTSAIERTARHGIEYENIPLKMDINSPLMRFRESDLSFSIRSGTFLDTGFARMEVIFSNGEEEIPHRYYLKERSGYYWLVFPQDFMTRGWRIVETKYFRIHLTEDQRTYLNPIAVNSLDNFVDSICEVLRISSDQQSALSESKIDYYYCTDANQVNKIAGVVAAGIYDLASDAIITSTFPHYHEIAHFLVNFRLKKLPISTLPLMGEGLATYLGGRAGRSPMILLDMAAYMLRSEMVSIQNLLELSPFHADVDAGLSYPCAALFVKFLIERTNIDSALALYSDLSARFDQTAGMTAEAISTHVARKTGETWSDIKSQFAEYYNSDLSLSNLSAYKLASVNSDLNFETNSAKGLGPVRMCKKGDRVFVICDLDSSDSSEKTILFNVNQELKGYKSRLFEEHFPNSLFEGYRFGLRFDRNEAGLYDYATSIMLAKYIASFDESGGYFDEESSTVSFSFKLDLTGGATPLTDAVLHH